jgi:hypothetical protein
MDRFFCRDFLIFVTYALAVYWGICIERSVQEIRDQNRPFPDSEGLVEQVPTPRLFTYQTEAGAREDADDPSEPSPCLNGAQALTAPCPITGYRSDSSVEDCSPCPANSATREIGATTVQQCLCDAGYEGTIENKHDTCWRGKVKVPSRRDRSAGDNSCPLQGNGICDEPYDCDTGTDTTDCLNAGFEGFNNPYCQHTNDGSCDEGYLCSPGSDTIDCCKHGVPRTKDKLGRKISSDVCCGGDCEAPDTARE